LPDVQGSAAKPSARPPPSSIVLVISGPVPDDQVVSLCERVGRMLERSGANLVICDVGALDDPDAATVDLVARLQLTARRLGRKVHLLDACGELQDLIELTGLSEIFSVSDELDLEPSGDPEQREPPGRVEEKRDPGDGIA
jgi:ABC-type transporter Mla MlaB component